MKADSGQAENALMSKSFLLLFFKKGVLSSFFQNPADYWRELPRPGGISTHRFPSPGMASP
jgi:hypothetical protein